MEIVDMFDFILAILWLALAAFYFFGDIRPDNRWLVPILMVLLFVAHLSSALVDTSAAG